MKREKKFAGFIAFLVILLFTSGNFYCKKNNVAVEKIKDSVTFIALGDWGRKGRQYQTEVAKQMFRVAKSFNVQFIVTTGDNFYGSGVADINDPHWQSSFEKVYTYDSLPMPWYPVLGNHDYETNPDAQISYSAISKRWTMPARYYSLKKKINGTDSVLFVFTDTSPFISHYYTNINMTGVKSQDTMAQRLWVQTTLSQSTDKWKIVLGHHPRYSAGNHGNSPDIARSLNPIFEKNNVNFYIAGHDHDLQYLKHSNGNVHHLISGGGSEIRTINPIQQTVFAKAVPGFMVMTIYTDSTNFYFFDNKGTCIYKNQVVK